jgi:hypothetical protein
MVLVAIVADIRLYREGLEPALERDGRIRVWPPPPRWPMRTGTSPPPAPT